MNSGWLPDQSKALPPHAEDKALQSSGVKETPSWLGSFTSDEKAQVAGLVREISRPSNFHGIVSLVFDYAVMACAMGVAIWSGHMWALIAAVVIIGSRQHALLVLMHDAAHFRLLKSRHWNDRVANFFCVWPFFATIEAYRRSHLEHHNFLNTDRDPDWVRKIESPAWDFPKTYGAIALILAGQLLGGGLIDLASRVLRLNSSATRGVRSRYFHWNRVLFYAALAGGLTWFGCWSWYLKLWLMPFATYLPFVLRLRSIAEHLGLPQDSEFSKSRHVNARWLERFLFAPHQVYCHTAHHLFPSVPFFQLTRLHRSLMAFPSYRDHVHANDGYFLGSSRSLFHDLRHCVSHHRAEEARTSVHP
jgi:fatty acid desaturase